jgi:predicted O-methyltransferase YrrM
VQYVPPGHFYSPIPSLDEVRDREAAIFHRPDSLPGIDLRLGAQKQLIAELARYYPDQPFDARPTNRTRYHFENDFFSYGDGLVLHTLLRHRRPPRIVEVGSGYSTALIRDTIDLFALDAQHVAIDPYPDTARRLLAGDTSTRIEPVPVQDVDRDLMTSLAAGDFLFIDSTHVSKVGSDVNVLVHEVLPRLSPGVVVHIHDMFYPFELPPVWVYEGRAWNENYLVRAFLTFNDRFRILLFNNLLAQSCADEVEQLMPLWRKNMGCSLWLERI